MEISGIGGNANIKVNAVSKSAASVKKVNASAADESVESASANVREAAASQKVAKVGPQAKAAPEKAPSRNNFQQAPIAREISRQLIKQSSSKPSSTPAPKAPEKEQIDFRSQVSVQKDAAPKSNDGVKKSSDKVEF